MNFTTWHRNATPQQSFTPNNSFLLFVCLLLRNEMNNFAVNQETWNDCCFAYSTISCRPFRTAAWYPLARLCVFQANRHSVACTSFLLSLCCFYLSAQAVSPEVPELKKSDANIMGHVLNKATKEHLPYITLTLKHCNRCYGTLFLKEFTRRQFCAWG